MWLGGWVVRCCVRLGVGPLGGEYRDVKSFRLCNVFCSVFQCLVRFFCFCFNVCFSKKLRF